MTAKRIAIQSRLIGRGKVMLGILLLAILLLGSILILINSGCTLIDMLEYPFYYTKTEIAEHVIIFITSCITIGLWVTKIAQGLING